MQTAALLKKEAPKTAVAAIGKATINPLQLKTGMDENEKLQLKRNPLQLKTGMEEEEDDEEEEPLQMKQNPLQLMDDKDEELLQKKQNPLQLKKSNQNPLQLKQAVNNLLQLQAVETAAPQLEKNNTGLPDNLKAGVENLSGYSMDDVKVHYNSDKPAQLQALAYAQGTDIHVAPGQEKHLPHEAWHVVQQKQGRVQPTMQMKQGVAVNDDKGLENEADMLGEKALQMKMQDTFSHQEKDTILAGGAIQMNVVQKVEIKVEGYGIVNTKDFTDMRQLFEELAENKEIMLPEEVKNIILKEHANGEYDLNEELKKLVEQHFRISSTDQTEGNKEVTEDNKEVDNPNIAKIDLAALKKVGEWQAEIGMSSKEKRKFLQSVVNKARQIMPVAINRHQEFDESDKNANNLLISAMAVCKDNLIKNFSTAAKGIGVTTDSNYIHPVIVQKIMFIVQNAADKVVEQSGGTLTEKSAKMSGICKDYASILYGLIRQNDPENTFQTQLEFIKDHVFVKVSLDNEHYVIDPWRTKGDQDDGVISKEGHIGDLNKKSRGNTMENRWEKVDTNTNEGKSIIKNSENRESSLLNHMNNSEDILSLFNSKIEEYNKDANEFLQTYLTATQYLSAGKY